jgi:mono/diheme cytochrome c family protein
VVIFSTILVAAAKPPVERPAAPQTSAQLETRLATVVRPFLKTYCVSCHGGENPEAEFDLTPPLTPLTAIAMYCRPLIM